jgi:diguanylate cyclase (GGDEF)-like protein
LLFVELYFEQRKLEESQKRYQQVAKEADKLINALLESNQEKVALAALYLSQQEMVKKAILTGNHKVLNFTPLFEKGAQFGSLSDANVQILDKNGVSFYRSWTDHRGDEIIRNRKDLQAFFQSPRVMHTISVGVYSLTLKTIVPLYEHDQFIGAFEVIGLMHGLLKGLKSNGIEPLVLVDSRYQQQFLDQSPDKYINGFRLVNADLPLSFKQAAHQIKTIGIDQSENYHLCDDRWFVSFKHLPAIDQKPMASFYLFQPLQPITNELLQPKSQVILFVLFLYLVSLIVYLSWHWYQNSQVAEAYSKNLQTEVVSKNLKLFEQANFYQKVIDGIKDIILVFTSDKQEVVMNEPARKLYSSQGFRKAKRISDFASNWPQRETVVESIRQKVAVTKVEEIDDYGDKRFIEFTATPFFGDDDEVNQVVEVGHDITPYMNAKRELEEQKAKLDQIAYFDSLTGLPNRRMFNDRLQRAISSAERAHNKVALMFIDLDLFKQINDTCGHDVGDKVLVRFSKRLRANIRKSDTVSRLGGDEFTVILEQIDRVDSVADIVDHILRSIRKPCTVESHNLYLSASIGLSVYPDDGESVQDLLKNADTAMYKAKEDGRNSYSFYDPVMTKKAVERIELENSLRRAIAEEQFEVYYQPQFDIRNNNIVGFEALVRWNSPELGLVTPIEFISLAEETGMIMQIGQQVMKQAMQTITDWHKKQLTNKRMAINISAKQFAHEDILKHTKSCLQQTGCKPEWIEFEITEASIMLDKTYAASVLTELKSLGIRSSIDDFGTGHSSLSQLKRMPIDRIKIDQSFLYELPYDSEGAEITKTIISLAKNLGMEPVAEGIENRAQNHFVQDYGCNYGQGFLFSKPLSKPDLEKQLFNHEL